MRSARRRWTHPRRDMAVWCAPRGCAPRGRCGVAVVTAAMPDFRERMGAGEGARWQGHGAMGWGSVPAESGRHAAARGRFWRGAGMTPTMGGTRSPRRGGLGAPRGGAVKMALAAGRRGRWVQGGGRRDAGGCWWVPVGGGKARGHRAQAGGGGCGCLESSPVRHDGWVRSPSPRYCWPRWSRWSWPRLGRPRRCAIRRTTPLHRTRPAPHPHRPPAYGE